MNISVRLFLASAVLYPISTLIGCTAGNYGATCIEPAAVEICGNLIDDDCNGMIDEGCNCTPGLTRVCWPDRSGNVMNVPVNTTEKSGCQAGTQTCANEGMWDPKCEGGSPPIDEICGNDIDEDCDGQLDDGDACTCVSGATRDCWVTTPTGTVSKTPPPSHDNIWSRCKKGTEQCINAAWNGKCLDAVGISVPGPQNESLDCRDNNCDGRIDEGLITTCKNPQTGCFGFYQCNAAGALVCGTPTGLPDTAGWHDTVNVTNGSWDWNCSGFVELNYCSTTACTVATNYFINSIDPAQVCSAVYTSTGTCPMYVAYNATGTAVPTCGGAIRATQCVAGAGTCTPMVLTSPNWKVYCR